jgi:hypothetical protein
MPLPLISKLRNGALSAAQDNIIALYELLTGGLTDQTVTIAHLTAQALSVPSLSTTGAVTAGSVVTTGTVSEKGLVTTAITSGALPTHAVTSGTGAKVLTTRDTVVALPYNIVVATDTVEIELSPDGTTYTTLVTLAPGIISTLLASIPVPANWYIRVTLTGSATLGAVVYY